MLEHTSYFPRDYVLSYLVAGVALDASLFSRVRIMSSRD